ncbi:MAG: iron-sulfur cluster repair di-iron protein [Saprospiraceae bacterium]|nr:iron-sulfur cluster repair di-iron protein [Saprospiraceae bacterium]
MQITDQKTIGEIVARDYRAAAVFTSYGIDFCCRGNRTLTEVCQGKDIKQDQLESKLNAAISTPVGDLPDFNSWPIDLLVDYVEKKHHRYINEATPVIQQYLAKLCKVHGHNHPELFEITEEFAQSAVDLAAHMKKEENILFPHVRKLAEAASAKEHMDPPVFGTVRNPVRMMMDEHTHEGDRFAKIAELSDQFTAPADGCTTYRVAFAMLKDFAADLHLHIHLENNIIFPACVEMEEMTV